MIRVLVVDDAAFMRLTVRKMLEKNGMEVIAGAKSFIVKPFKEENLVSAIMKLA